MQPPNWDSAFAVLMHKLGLTEVDITAGDIAAYAIKYGEGAGLAFWKVGDGMAVKLVTKAEAALVELQPHGSVLRIQ